MGQLDAEVLHPGQDGLPVCANPVCRLLLLMLYIGHQLHREQGRQTTIMTLVSVKMMLI